MSSEKITNCNSFDGWLTSHEAAKYLKIETRTLLAWTRAGAIKGHVLHGTKRRVWRFRKEELDAAMGFVTGLSTMVMVQSQPSSVVLQ